MKAQLNHNCHVDANRVIHSIITAYDDEGTELFTVHQSYERSHSVYATYKTLFAALQMCAQHDVIAIDIISNHASVVRELNGQPNPNARLLEIMRERLDETGVTLGDVEYAVS